MAPISLLTFDNTVFSSFAFYSVVVILKLFAMAALTAKHRGNKMIFANPEDYQYYRKNLKPNFNDADVERARRNHLNDLENIPPFILLGFFYVLLNPDPVTALWHFRLFAGSRIMHTISYQLPLPQPSRTLCWIVGVACTLSMAVQILLKAI